jgi:hypothetical protein
MEDYCQQNKKAWEYNAYDFWINNSGEPKDRAKKDLEDPRGMLKRYADYFETYKDIKVANICGSCGKKAIPLCSYRKYTISEIINSVITTGFTLSRFDEHPAWKNKSVPGEFTLVARR